MLYLFFNTFFAVDKILSNGYNKVNSVFEQFINKIESKYNSPFQ